MRKVKAFTLVELLIVISIIGILAGMVVFAMRTATIRARDARAKSSVTSVQSAVETIMTSADNINTYLGCSGASGCSIDASFIANKLVDPTTNTTLLNSVPQDGGSGNVYIKTTGATAYEIAARSGVDNGKCWVASTTATTNLSGTAPGTCPAWLP